MCTQFFVRRLENPLNDQALLPPGPESSSTSSVVEASSDQQASPVQYTVLDADSLMDLTCKLMALVISQAQKIEELEDVVASRDQMIRQWAIEAQPVPSDPEEGEQEEGEQQEEGGEQEEERGELLLPLLMAP